MKVRLNRWVERLGCLRVTGLLGVEDYGGGLRGCVDNLCRFRLSLDGKM